MEKDTIDHMKPSGSPTDVLPPRLFKEMFDSKHQRRQMKVSADSPYPHIFEQISSEKHSGQCPKALRKEGDTVRSHSYSGNRGVGDRDDFLQREQMSTPKAAQSSPNTTNTLRKVADRNGARGFGPAAQKSCVHFEVKMCDFPELSGCSVASRSSPPSAGHKERMSVTGRSPTPQDPQQSSSKPCPLVVPAGGTVETSWANVASQPPKKRVPQERTTSSSGSLQSREMLNCHRDNSTIKKKNRKKKKKNSKEEDKETEDTLVHQEPPKFEDEDEFPGLMSSSHAHTQEKQRDRGQQQSKHNQDKPPVSIEMLRNGQKTEKVCLKKSKAPVQLDIGNVLAVLEKKQQSLKDKAVVLSVGGGLPVVHKPTSSLQKKPEKFAHNPLDSTSPLVKKGKQREVPKVKKPTALKKVILKEREERKQRRLLEESGDTGEGEVVSPCEEAEDQTNINDSNHKHEDEEEETRSQDSGCVNRVNIHSRRFRDYCSQMLSRDVDECVTTLLKELVRFQDRLYQKDPMKARMKRRMVMGLREVLKHLRLRKVKCVIISPNCERVQSKGGLDEALYTIINTCREQEIPFVFALSRKALGRCVNKAVPVSMVGIFNYDGAQDHYHKMIELSSEARGAYDMMVSGLEQKNHTGHQAEVPEPSPHNIHPDEPEYIRLWRTFLVNEKNQQEALGSLCLNKNKDCDKNTEEEEEEES